MNRRSILKKGLFTIGSVALAPHLVNGAFAEKSFTLDHKNRLYYSPFMREYFVEGMTVEPPLLAKLNANENPYGPPPSALEAAKNALSGGNRYAWRELMELIDMLAEKENVSKEQILMGPGSSDLLEKVAMVLLGKGDNVVSADPTYMSLIRVAEAVGASWKAVPCGKGWTHDTKAMEAAIDSKTKLVYVCNPNNPMGTLTPAKELMDFCSRVSEKVPVFVDEAYIELAYGPEAQSMVGLLQKGKNIMVARTFSKIMGMAGMRIGYMAAQPEMVEKISSITRGGMGISYPSVHAAIAATKDKDFQAMTKEKNEAAKAYVASELKSMGYEPVPSSTNFMIFPIPFEGKKYLEKMYAKGVGVRSFHIKDSDWCRVSMGTMDEMKTFIAALKSIS